MDYKNAIKYFGIAIVFWGIVVEHSSYLIWDIFFIIFASIMAVMGVLILFQNTFESTSINNFILIFQNSNLIFITFSLSLGILGIKLQENGSILLGNGFIILAAIIFGLDYSNSLFNLSKIILENYPVAGILMATWILLLAWINIFINSYPWAFILIVILSSIYIFVGVKHYLSH